MIAERIEEMARAVFFCVIAKVSDERDDELWEAVVDKDRWRASARRHIVIEQGHP